MPQVGVAKTDRQEEQEEAQRQQLHHQEILPALAPFLAQLAALAVGQEGAQQGQQGDHRADRQPLEGDAEGAGQPGEVSQQQHPGGARQRVAVVGQARQRQAQQRVSQHAQQADAQVPDHHPHHLVPVVQRLGVEVIGPGASGLLLGQPFGRQGQRAGVGFGLLGRDAHNVVNIGRFQDLAGVLGIVIRGFAEDQHLGMVIDGEGFLGELGIDVQRPNLGVRLEDRHQLEAQVALEHARLRHPVAPFDAAGLRAAQQVAVVQLGHREALGQARQRAPLAVGADGDVIGLVVDAQETLQLLAIVIPIHVEVQLARVDAAEAVIPAHPHRQAVIPIPLVGQPGALKLDGAVPFLQHQRELVALLGHDIDRAVQRERVALVWAAAAGG